MGLGKLYKSLLKGNYAFGRRASADYITNEMPAEKAKPVGAAVDAVAVAALTYISILPAISWGGAAVTAITAAITAPAVIPTALGVIGSAALAIGFASFAVPLAAGFTSAAMDKLNIPKPVGTVAKVKIATRETAQTIAKPFKFVGNKLSQTFKKAHDGKKATPQTLPVIAVSAPVPPQI